MAELTDPRAAAGPPAGERLRVLHLTTRFTRGGAERNMAHVMCWERDRGHEVHLVVGRDSEPELVPPGVQVHVLDSLRRSVRPWTDLKAIADVRRLIGRHSFDVVHTHESKAGAVGRLAARGRAGALVHSIHMPSFGPGYSALQTALFSAVERLCSRFTDVYVSVGREILELYLQHGIGTGKPTFIVRSPVDLSSFAALRETSPAAKAHQRRALGLDPDRPTVLTMGRLEPRKRPELILRELASTLEECGAQLLFAGEGPEHDRLAQTVRDLGVGGRVRLLGHTDDPVAAMRCADVLVHASVVEGVPQVVLQALSAGLPVVATEVEGLREVPGAPVTAVARSGAGLADAVAAQLGSEPPPPAKLAQFAEWLPDRIDEALEDFHEVLHQMLASRRDTGQPATVTERSASGLSHTC